MQNVAGEDVRVRFISRRQRDAIRFRLAYRAAYGKRRHGRQMRRFQLRSLTSLQDIRADAEALSMLALTAIVAMRRKLQPSWPSLGLQKRAGFTSSRGRDERVIDDARLPRPRTARASIPAFLSKVRAPIRDRPKVTRLSGIFSLGILGAACAPEKPSATRQ